MPLHPGTRLGGYDVLALLGAGGMGEVYRARDTKLNRDMTVKLWAEVVAPDPESAGQLLVRHSVTTHKERPL